jgi:uncharacterized lipoprotein YmbA
LKSSVAAVCLLGLLCACASSRPDHFYILATQPAGAAEARLAGATQVALKVTVPSLVDRSEIILNTSADGVAVLEHERWAAPLSDLVAQTLARDLERRRGDLLVTGQSLNRAAGPVIRISVDLVQVTIRRSERATIDTHWHIVDPRSGKDEVGGEVFSAPLGQEAYAAVAQGLSDCLGLLADRLAGRLQ